MFFFPRNQSTNGNKLVVWGPVVWIPQGSLDPQNWRRFADLNTPASYRFRAPSIGGSLGSLGFLKSKTTPGQATLVFVLYTLIPGISVCLATRSVLQGAQEAGVECSQVAPKKPSDSQNMSNENNPGWLGYIGDNILPS